MTKIQLHIGIDPGTHTGIAMINSTGHLFICTTMAIHEAMREVDYWVALHGPGEVHIIVEDARKRGANRRETSDIARAKAQGAGSIKRDSAIWEDYLTFLKVSHTMIPPMRNGTAYREMIFASVYPYWTQRTSEHARAAANMISSKSITKESLIKDIIQIDKAYILNQ